MRCLIQRVTRASVRVDGEEVGAIGAGLCAFVGVTHGDDTAVAAKLAQKVWHLRVFNDEHGVMQRSLADLGGSVLVVSQFSSTGTRAADGGRLGSRPRRRRLPRRLSTPWPPGSRRSVRPSRRAASRPIWRSTW